MTLYEITDEIKTLEDMIENALTDPEGNLKDLAEEDKTALLALVDETQGKFADKAERICRYMANVKAQAEACKAEEERLAKRRKASERKTDALKWILETSMIRAGMEKAEAGTFKLAIQKNPPSVFIARLDDVPPEYWRIIPETREPDKRKMLEDLKAGEKIPGVLLAQTSGLRVR